MNKFFTRIAASALALTTTAAYMPLSAFKTYAEETSALDFDASHIALYAKKSVKLNEKSVNVKGGVYSGSKPEFTGADDKFSVSGQNVFRDGGVDCELPDFVGLINSAEEYDFEFEGDKEIFDSAADLTLCSSYTSGNLVIDHAKLEGSGRISASGDIKMSIAGGDQLSQAFIMSEEGDITIDAGNLDYTGVIYAPNGKVKINAKNIDLVGAIYADSIEINGTSVNIEYRDFFKINCKAHTEPKVFINKKDTLKLEGTVSHQEADTLYKVPASQADRVTITGEDTLTPEISFTKSGEYDITLTAQLGNKQSSDTVKVVVTDGPVVNYTSTADFSSGNLSAANGAKDELKLADARNTGAGRTKKYSPDSESGINVTAKQSKNAIRSSGDKLDLDFSLEGYGQLVTGNGNDLVLCIDNSGSVWDMIPTIKAAALQIIESMGPNDRLGITSLDRLNTPLTSDKEALIAAIERYNLGGGSDYGNGLRIVNNEIFDEESEGRNKYIFLLADGENGWDYPNDDEIAMEQAAIFKENGTKVYSFEINPFSYDFTDTSTMQDVAIKTNGAYKLCPDANAITKFLLNMADTIYNLAARNVTFTTTVTNADWLKNAKMKKAPDSTVKNPDGSVTLSWNYSSFEIGASDDIGLSLNTGLIKNKGYVQVTKDTKLISYDANGEGNVLYLDDIIVGSDDYADNGHWTSKTFDSGVENCPWSYVNWNADYVGDSAMDIYLSTSNDGVNFSEPQRVTNGEELALKGRYIRTEISMKASSDGDTPVLYDLTIYSDETEASDIHQGADVAIKGARTVPAGSPVSLWLDINGRYDNVTDVKWNIVSAVDLSDGKEPLLRTVSFDKEGEYTVSAEVTSGGIKTAVAIKVNVLPKTALWQEVEKEEFKAVKMTLSDVPAYATQYQEPLTFNINFENPEQVSWVRALYTNPKVWGEGVYRIAYINEVEDNLVSVPLPYNNLTDTTIVVDAFDWYGNKTTEKRVIKMDREAPRVTVGADKSSVYPGKDVLITVTVSDNDEIAKLVLTCNGEEVKLDDENKYVFHTNEAGDYVFEATATDKAGNETKSSRSVKVYADNNGPNLYINGSSRIIIGNSADYKITAYDNETFVDTLKLTLQKDEEEPETVLSLDSKDGVIEKENIYKFTPEAIGNYVLTATVKDREGNEKSYDYKIAVVSDTSAPSISIKLSKTEVLAGEASDVTVTVTDDVAVADVKFFIDDKETKLSEDNTFHYVSDGENVDKNGNKYITFKVVATDTSGNERTSTARLLVRTEDTTAPSVSISASNRYEYNSSNAYMTVNASDNIGIDTVEVKVNGETVTLDENGRYYFDTTLLTDYTISATATDTSGNQRTAEKTVSIVDTTKPAVSFKADKNSYATLDSPVITVDVTDNYKLETVTADIDGTPIDTNNGSFTYTIPEAAAGKYVINVKAEDSSGNVRESSYTVTVRDTVAPELTASADKEKYKKSEKPVIKCEYSDNVGVTKVTADMNGKSLEFDIENGQVIMPDEIEAGDKTVTIKAYDAAGNASEPAVVNFYISATDDTECPVIEEIATAPEIIRVGSEVTVKIKATDDSGEVILTVTKDGTVLEENAESGTYTFTPDKVGDVKLSVRAEDPSGNYTETEVELKVYRNTENRKIVVDSPVFAKPGEEITVTLSSADGVPFDATELWMGEQNLSASLTKDADGKSSMTFTLDKNGKYGFKAVGKDNDGYSDEKLFDIQITSTYEDEIKSAEMQESMKQTSETQLNDELKELAKTFESPADAYEYVYNNINFEAYTNSRRGALGAYELKRGNDYDQASLLIGLLREMGYPAKYTTGNAALSSDQVKALMSMDNFETATRVLASNGKNAAKVTRTDGSQYVKLEETFVQVYVPASEIGETDEKLKDLGVWVPLDPSIKDTTLACDEIEPAAETTVDITKDRELYAGTEFGDILDTVEEHADSLAEKSGDSTISDMFKGAVTLSDEPTYIYSRNIVQKEFNRLPANLSYQFTDAEMKAFNAIPDNKTDRIQFYVSGLGGKNLGVYKISDIYNKRVTLRFEGNDGDKTIFEMDRGQIEKNTFLPALYVDGEIAAQYSLKEHSSDLEDMFEPEDEYYFFGKKAWRLGEHCKLTTSIVTNGHSTSWQDDIVIGSTYAMVIDVGGITKSQYNDSLNVAAESNGIDASDPSEPVVKADTGTDMTNYYDEDKIGSLLNFMGTYYFLKCDAYDNTSASFSNLEVGNDTKVLMTSYKINSREETTMGHVIDVIPGRFEIDVSYNSGTCFSRCDDVDARNQYMYNAAYMESYYEGWIWEAFFASEGASTVAVLNKALQDGSELVCINKDNIETEIAKVSLESDEEKEIRDSVSQGLSVIIPAKRVEIKDWSGTGYIIADMEEYNHFVFKLSGGTNGGSDTEDIDLIGETLAEVYSHLDTDKVFTGLFTATQTVYYILLEISLYKEIAPAISELAAASGGGPAMVLIGGLSLLDATKHLVDIMNYRVEMLEIFYEYCVGDEEGAQEHSCVDLTVLLIKMLKDLYETLTGGDDGGDPSVYDALKEYITSVVEAYDSDDEDDGGHDGFNDLIDDIFEAGGG